MHTIAERTILARDGEVALADLVEGERDYIDAHSDRTYDPDPDVRPVPFQVPRYQAAVIHLTSGELLGAVTWRPVPHATTLSGTAWNLGIHLLPGAIGRGLSTVTGRLLVRYLFETTDLDRIQAITDVANVPGWRGLEKLGFQREGVLRGITVRDGERQDFVSYSILRSDLEPSGEERTVLAGRDGVLLARALPHDRSDVAAASGALILHQDPRLSPPAPIHRVAVLDEDTGRLIGTASWRAVDYGGSLAWRISVLLVPDARGRGIGNVAQRLLAEYLFATTELDRVEAGTDVEDPAERRALEKAGFRCDGVVRGAQVRGGRRRDVALYGILRADI